MVAKVYSVTGEEVREIELPEHVFNRRISEGAVYHAINCELANRRQGTASTKTRSEINCTKSKPWRQKGTGRARSGSRNSPVWVGGGVVFGPRPRDYSYKIPKKMKRVAMRSILSMKALDNEIKIIEDFTVESGKTRDLVNIVSKLTPAERSVIVLKDDDKMIKRAGRNIPWLSFLSFNRLRAHDLFYGKHIICQESAVTKLGEFYQPSVKAKQGTIKE